MSPQEIEAMLKAPSLVETLKATANVADIARVIHEMTEPEAKAALMVLVYSLKSGAASAPTPVAVASFTPAPSELLTIREALEHLPVSSNTLRKLIREGKLKSVRVGNGIRISRQHIDQYIRENTQ